MRSRSSKKQVLRLRSEALGWGTRPFLLGGIHCGSARVRCLPIEWHRCSRGRALNAIVRRSSLDDLRSNPSGSLKGHRVDLRNGSAECVERPAGTQV
jgi:hypothetical protein